MGPPGLRRGPAAWRSPICASIHCHLISRRRTRSGSRAVPGGVCSVILGVFKKRRQNGIRKIPPPSPSQKPRRKRSRASEEAAAPPKRRNKAAEGGGREEGGAGLFSTMPPTGQRDEAEPA
ncbi:unnamed protein product, partial [Amoebophrya sp. A120]|eukprot:GSA120T00021203001.1